MCYFCNMFFCYSQHYLEILHIFTEVGWNDNILAIDKVISNCSIHPPFLSSDCRLKKCYNTLFLQRFVNMQGWLVLIQTEKRTCYPLHVKVLMLHCQQIGSRGNALNMFENFQYIVYTVIFLSATMFAELSLAL